MKADASTLVKLRVPAEDGALTRALAELDSRMAAWAAALARVPDLISVSSRTGGEPPRAAVERQPEPSAEAEVEVASRAIVEAAPTPEVAAEAVIQAEPERVESSTVEAVEADAPAAEAVAVAAEARSSVVVEEPAAPAKVVSPDDDESLLAGLDPEAVRAIRVQRRLLDGQKTLRQLVEEYRAAGPSQASARNEKKSWWSRGKK